MITGTKPKAAVCPDILGYYWIKIAYTRFVELGTRDHYYTWEDYNSWWEICLVTDDPDEGVQTIGSEYFLWETESHVVIEIGPKIESPEKLG